MPSRRPLLCCLMLTAFAACGSKPGATTNPVVPENATLTASTLERLTIPPGERSLEAVRTLETLGDDGNAKAAWERTHYLLDLFDAARFGGSTESLSLLAEIAGRPRDSMHGPAATQAIAELLVLESDRVLEIDRRHPQAQQARIIAGYDAAGPSERSQVFQAMQELKRIRKRDGALAANARLRLFGYCRSALTDAGSFDRPGQRIALSHCLYPLFESDPEPYFDSDADRRPPPPALGRILEKQRFALPAKGEGRLSAALKTQRDWLAKYSEVPVLLPALDPTALRLPPAKRAHPYDDYPILASSPKPTALKSQLLADGRRTVAVALAAERPGSELLAAATAASDAGAGLLAVLVATRQRLRVPSGDYWDEQVENEQVSRVGEIVFSLAALKAAPDNAPGRRTQVKAAHWSRRRATLSLHLLVAPTQWSLVSTEGLIARFPVNDKEQSPTALVRSALAQVRSAFPDERGLVLVPQKGVSIGALVLAAEAASQDAAGHPLFSRLALTATAPRVRAGRRLLSRIQRRASLGVQVDPATLAGRVPAVMHCYQGLADKSRAPTGEVRLELGAAGKITPQGASKALQECAVNAFGPNMTAQALRAVRVTFTAKAK